VDEARKPTLESSAALVGGLVPLEVSQMGEPIALELEVSKDFFQEVEFILIDPPTRSALVDENDNPLPLTSGRFVFLLSLFLDLS